MNSAWMARQLDKTGLAICAQYVPAETVQLIRLELEERKSEGAFRRAAVGMGSGRQVHERVRRDDISWIDASEENSTTALLDDLKLTLNRQLFLGLLSHEAHFAIYPAGGFYSRHLDSFRGDDARMVSFILYLNESWSYADGGQLRIFQGEAHTDVEPRGGTMVCFLSREFEHEVLLNHSPRYSLTGWFKTK